MSTERELPVRRAKGKRWYETGTYLGLRYEIRTMEYLGTPLFDTFSFDTCVFLQITLCRNRRFGRSESRPESRIRGGLLLADVPYR